MEYSYVHKVPAGVVQSPVGLTTFIFLKYCRNDKIFGLDTSSTEGVELATVRYLLETESV